MGNIVNRVFESAGPDGKVRGTPQQIIDKYQALARDAQVSGDRVAAENYLQHSEHYSRLLGETQRQQNEQRYGQDREETASRGGDEQPEQRPQGNSQGQINGGAPQRGGAEPAQPRSKPAAGGFGLETIEPEDGEAEFGPIPTPENGGAQPRLTVPAADYKSGDGQPADPRDTTPSVGAPVADDPTPAAASEPASGAPAAEASVPEAGAVAPASDAPKAEEAPAPKRTRTRRKKADGEAEEKPKTREPRARTRKTAAAPTSESPAEDNASREGGSEVQAAESI